MYYGSHVTQRTKCYFENLRGAHRSFGGAGSKGPHFVVRQRMNSPTYFVIH